MFEFLSMLGDYEQRKVACYDEDGVFVSTAAVCDGRKPFETAVEHPRYNDGKLVIVECYDTREDAEKGHKLWVRLMTAKRLPTVLTDCTNAEVSQLSKLLGNVTTFEIQ